MAYTTIKKPSDYFNTILYTGDGTGTQSQTGVGFEPDMVWVKSRNAGNYHGIADQVRGVDKFIYPNDNLAEQTNATDYLNSFDSDGFTHGLNGTIGQNSVNYVAWNWLANGAGSANTDGSISSTVSANTTSGFSIVSYTGNGTNNATFGHGLGVAPKIMIGKCRGNTHSWQVTGNAGVLTENDYLTLDTSNAKASSVNVTFDASATTIKLQGGQGTNVSGQPHIAYCFAEKQGYSKFGSYTGNGNADGSFIYTGFSPAFVMIKETTGTGKWVMKDNRRTGINVNQSTLYANESDAEGTPGYELIDLLSNGFKQRGTGSYVNGSGTPYIYMAFAEQPLVGDNPATAR